MGKKIKFTRNPSIKKGEYLDKKEYLYDKNTNVVPDKRNRMLIVMFAEDRSASFFYHKPVVNVDGGFDFFRYRKGMYIIDNESIHIANNGTRVSFYLEGISTPIKMSNIERETSEVEYIDLSGEKRTSIITKIKGLKFDAKILDTFANRRFSELFTVVKADKITTLLFIFSLVIMCLCVGNIIASYFFQGVVA